MNAVRVMLVHLLLIRDYELTALIQLINYEKNESGQSEFKASTTDMVTLRATT